MHFGMATLGIEGRSASKMSTAASMTGIATVSIPAAIGTKGGGGLMPGRSQYQGGSTFTVFSAQGSNPLVNCKLCGKGIQKVYDKSVKGYVYSCTGAHSSKIQLPKDESKTGLQLIHPYLVLQLFIPTGQHFNLELRVSDTTNTRRKMYFSTSFSELKITPLHCQIPISMVNRNIWVSLALHVPDLFYNCFRVISFRSVEVIVLGPVCKLRKIFTLRTRLIETGAENSLGIEEPLPQEHMFASGVENCSQVIDIAKLQSALGIEIPTIDACARAGPESVLSARKLTLNRMEYPRQVHVAFGSRMPLVAQQNTPAIDDRADRVVKERVAKPPQDTSLDTAKPTASEKTDQKSPVAARSATPDVSPPGPGAKKGADASVETAKVDKKSSSAEAAPAEAPATENKPALLKGGGAKSVKKKEEQTWKKAEIPYIANGKHARKDAELVKAKDLRQQVRYEDSPPITPCGWERSTSARGSDDMNFKVHTLFEKLGDYSHDDTDIPSLSEDGEGEDKDKDLGEDELGQMPSPVKQAAGLSKEQPEQKKASKERDAEGLKFYQFEIEKDFMLREGNSASASDDESWCSGSSGRASPNALSDLEDLVKKTRLTGSGDNKKSAASKEETTVFDSTEDLFVVHEQDHSNLDDHEELLDDSGEDPVFEPHMVAKPILKLDSMRSVTGPNSARKISPGPSSSRRRSRSAQLEELCGHPTSDDLEGTSEDDLDLLYDPTLDCYYDPKTNRYYELK